MARPLAHVALAMVAVAAPSRWWDRPRRGAFLVASILVDADHLVDYALFRWHGRRSWIVLPAHAWEWVALLLLGGLCRSRRGVAVAAAAGLLFHLVTDQVTNRPTAPALYSMLYRLSHRFAADRLGPGHGVGVWMRRSWWAWL